MASCLWMYPCLLSIIFTFVATEEIKENITCTFTNGKDCSHLLNLNNTTEYTIEREEINRTGVKIIFDTKRGVKFLHVESGEELEKRVQVINITRGSLNHLVYLSCLKEKQVNRIKLEPVIVSKEIQIDFVKGCGNDSDPITIKSIHYTFGTDEDDLFQNASQRIPLSEEPFKAVETQTPEAYISTGLSRTTLLTTLTDQQLQSKKAVDVSLEESTAKTTSRLLTKSTKPIPTSHFTKMMLVATGKLMTVTKKNEVKEKEKADEKINFKVAVGASKSSAQKVSRDLTCLFLVLFVFYNA